MGGLAGHISHLVDYDNLRKSDIEKMIDDLFEGRVSNITEKIDGMNIQVSVNLAGDVVFFRNKGDIKNGGMTLDMLKEKYVNNKYAYNVFVSAADIINSFCKMIDKNWFNDGNIIRTLNCESILSGQTNIIPYTLDRGIYIHSIFEYNRNGDVNINYKDLNYLKKIIVNYNFTYIKITPEIKIQQIADSDACLLRDSVKAVFDYKNISIREWKKEKWDEYTKENYTWMNDECRDILFDRYFYNDKQINLLELKKRYGQRIMVIEKSCKSIIKQICEPLNDMGMIIENIILKYCWAFINSCISDNVCTIIKGELYKAKQNYYSEYKYLFDKFDQFGGQINCAEGIVFTWNGMLIKFTGSFAIINRILGDIKYKK